MKSGSISGSHLEEDRTVFLTGATGGLGDSSSMMIEAEASELTEDNLRLLLGDRLRRLLSLTTITDSSLKERLKALSAGESKMTDSLSLSARLIVPFNWVLLLDVRDPLEDALPARLIVLNVARQHKFFCFMKRIQMKQKCNKMLNESLREMRIRNENEFLATLFLVDKHFSTFSLFSLFSLSLRSLLASNTHVCRVIHCC